MIKLGSLVDSKAFGKFEQGKVYSNPYAKAFTPQPAIKEAEDHEVSMANNSLDTIIKMATELKAKMGENEKDIPAWIQDHITNAENFISQASSNYHEYGKNESVNEANTFSAPGQWVAYLSMTRGKKLLKTFDTARGAKQYLSKNVDKLLSGSNVESVGIMTKKEWDEREAKYAIESVKGSKLNEMGPNDVHFKQVMSFYDKGSASAKKAVSIFVSGKTNASRNQIADDLGDMGYNEILDVVDHFKLDEKSKFLKNENMIRLANLLKEGLGPDNAMVAAISDALKKELGVENVKVKKYSQGRARQGYDFYPDGTKGGLYIDEAYDGTWNIYTTKANGFPNHNHWEISSFSDDIEDSATALKAALAVIKKFKKDLQ